ncbi:hypothetical protein FMN52_12695 [Marinobacter sp. BW6]|uniref:hypothetical protein n=1 Tax=Marinobacter sp. BW6 TaxID=2592624 RepID=UPI0011DE9C55|nr:hypothetical protein [Marinobacter sp. BW6]TYC57410.1 hypothetical protein FMN52_12695 [Marinobacter sp. BW6]
MKTTELIEKWLDKCDLARLAQERYEEDPSPTNYTELKNAMSERRLMEERVEPRASYSQRVAG